MIQVQNLVKDYGSLRAVDSVSFSVQSGEIVGLLGPNGAGKTTIMKVLTGYHYPTSGTAYLNGIDVGLHSKEAKQNIGYLPETAPLYTDMTVHEYLSFIADSRQMTAGAKKAALESAVSECGLESVYHRLILSLSKGYRQRVGLAQAILHSPEILILDEPTTGLDPNQILEIRSLIKKIGSRKTVILSTHIMQEVEAVCDRVIIINKGRIAAEGTPDSISRQLSGTHATVAAEFKGLSDEELQNNGALFVQKCASIPGASQITVSRLSDGKISLSFSMDRGADACETVFDFAVRHQYKLLALQSKKLNLEDIFVRLTSDSESKGDRV